MFWEIGCSALRAGGRHWPGCQETKTLRGPGPSSQLSSAISLSLLWIGLLSGRFFFFFLNEYYCRRISVTDF